MNDGIPESHSDHCKSRQSQDDCTADSLGQVNAVTDKMPYMTRKRKNEYPSDLSKLESKRTHSLTSRNIVRTRINNDKKLWETLGTLNEDHRTAGVIPRLGQHFKNKTMSVYLCSPYTDHIATDYVDLGWGCGYRNCQMLMTFLQRQKEAGDCVLRLVADIAGLQRLLEKAWEEGFDPQGAAEMNYKVSQTQKWIGTTEVYCILVYLGVRCTILDFGMPTGPGQAHDRMFDWIQSYFETKHDTDPKVVHVTDRPPLYLQHSGHSRTVIGIELLKNGKRNLIMFDPGRRMLRSASHHSKKATSTQPEEDIDESGLSSVTDDDDDDFQSSPSRDPASFKKRQRAQDQDDVPDGLLRPLRVDAKAIAKNRQYQLLVLGEVSDRRDQGGHICWNASKGFLLTENEREMMKNITSVGVA